MKDEDVFWRLDALSDRQLLERMGSVLGSSRRLMAELVAHLGEVEERRLHLVAACSSLFAYCLKLGMTEDEAYRRIEVARLARRYPVIFPLLAGGQLTISTVALLKHHLSNENHLELLTAASGRSVAQTRELVATLFPRPDVASSVRKLPERQATIQRPPRASCPIEPLSAQRYKVQLTASAELARKLELARDLMRHSHPGGELGPIVERALDLLIENLMHRRFGKSKKTRPKRTTQHAAHDLEQRNDLMAHGSTLLGTAQPATIVHRSAEADMTAPGNVKPDSANVLDHRRYELTPSFAESYIPRSTRRAVVERDGLGCSWVDEHGIRCGSRSWLEYDHRHPRAKGGGSEPDNLRLLCRSHNRLAAEREYGKEHIERTIADRTRARARAREAHASHAI